MPQYFPLYCPDTDILCLFSPPKRLPKTDRMTTQNPKSLRTPKVAKGWVQMQHMPQSQTRASLDRSHCLRDHPHTRRDADDQPPTLPCCQRPLSVVWRWYRQAEDQDRFRTETVGTAPLTLSMTEAMPIWTDTAPTADQRVMVSPADLDRTEVALYTTKVPHPCRRCRHCMPAQPILHGHTPARFSFVVAFSSVWST